MKLLTIKRAFSNQQAAAKTTQRIKRFYKNVDVVEHPIMGMLQPADLRKANFAVDADTLIGLDNLSKIR